ncbi:hypothetical protein K9L16_01155 [Candidatus Pacearchaeota archaeon]|nr:hypothetical protein [Candidatus Pacearchaeota archaeon]
MLENFYSKTLIYSLSFLFFLFYVYYFSLFFQKNSWWIFLVVICFVIFILSDIELKNKDLREVLKPRELKEIRINSY